MLAQSSYDAEIQDITPRCIYSYHWALKTERRSWYQSLDVGCVLLPVWPKWRREYLGLRANKTVLMESYLLKTDQYHLVGSHCPSNCGKPWYKQEGSRNPVDVNNVGSCNITQLTRFQTQQNSEVCKGRRTNQSLRFKNSVFNLLGKPSNFCLSFNKTPVQSHNSPPAPKHVQSPLSRKCLTILATPQKEQKERTTNCSQSFSATLNTWSR
jgi:hypothetical protein